MLIPYFCFIHKIFFRTKEKKLDSIFFINEKWNFFLLFYLQNFLLWPSKDTIQVKFSIGFNDNNFSLLSFRSS